MSHPADGSNPLGEFLRARRERLTPGDVGLGPRVGLRRTPGLRREEVAVLSGLSANYYTRLEQGRERHPSAAVIDSLARSLGLTPDEHVHLRSIAAQAAGVAPILPAHTSSTLHPSAPTMLEALRPFAAYALNRAGDILAANPGGEMLYPGMDEWPPEQRNIVRYLFLHPGARDLYLADWQQHASTCISSLRLLATEAPDDPALTELVAELRENSPEFRTYWQYYDVRPHTETTKTLNHPLTGALTLDFQALGLLGSESQRISVFYALAGTPTYDALKRLDEAGAEAADCGERGLLRAQASALERPN